jgi:hypothetical protein
MRSFPRPLAALVAVVLLATQAAAQDRPATMPTTDVTIDYTLDVANAGAPVPKQVRAYIKAGGSRARFEAPGMPGYLVVDRTHAKMFVVFPAQRAVMTLPFDRARMALFTPDEHTSFARQGTDTVAGQDCTVWNILRDGHGATGCISADGLILRGSSADPSGPSGQLLATTVAYGKLGEILFEPPPGFNQMNLQHLAIPGHKPPGP